MTWTRAHDGTYSCEEHGAAFASGRACPSCTPADSPLAADQATDSTQSRDGSVVGGEPGALDLIDCRRRIASSADRQRRIARDARRIGRESDDMDDETQKRRALRLSSLNVESQAADRELKALRAATEAAVESAKFESDEAIIAESRAVRRAADEAVVH